MYYEFVESPYLHIKKIIEHNMEKVNAYCPIDKTQLVKLEIYQIYGCLSCGANYSKLLEETLMREAKNYLNKIMERLLALEGEKSRLQAILNVANKTILKR